MDEHAVVHTVPDGERKKAIPTQSHVSTSPYPFQRCPNKLSPSSNMAVGGLGKRNPSRKAIMKCFSPSRQKNSDKAIKRLKQEGKVQSLAGFLNKKGKEKQAAAKTANQEKKKETSKPLHDQGKKTTHQEKEKAATIVLIKGSKGQGSQ